MKQIPSKIGLRLRELRQSRRQTQESLALECRQRGFAITRTKLAKYEIGMTQVPAHFIPVLAYVLKVDVTDLLPPITRRSSPGASVARADGKNLKLFFALQTLNENSVEVENQPSRPA
jgi:transcriptional regulator with XRE-family HTH domain